MAKKAEGFAPGHDPISAIAAHVAKLVAACRRVVSDGLTDTEAVHRLRVQSRRTAAALEILRPTLPKQTRGRLRRIVRKIRRAAGRARDLDVFLSLLPETQPAVDVVRGFALGERSAAYRDLADQIEGMAAKLESVWMKTERLDRAPNNREASLENLLEDAIRRRSERVRQRLEARDLDEEDLHRLRIEVKGLRYAQELAGEDASWAKTLQDALGRARDLSTAVARIGQIRREVEQGFPGVARRLQRSLDALQRGFQTEYSAQIRTLLEAVPGLRRQALQSDEGLAPPS